MPLPHQNKKESRVERRRSGGRVCAGPGSAGRRGRRGKDFSVGSAALLRAGGGRSSPGHLLFPVPAPRNPPSAPDAAPTRPSRALGPRAGDPLAPRRPARTPSTSAPRASPPGPRRSARPPSAPPAPRTNHHPPGPAGAPRVPQPHRRPAHLALARLRPAPGTCAALSAPAPPRSPWARRGPAQPGPGERAGRRRRRRRGERSHGPERAHCGRARAHPTPRLGGRGRGCSGSGSGSGSGVRRGGGRGPRSRLGRRARPRVTGPGRRAGPPAGMRSCQAKKAPDVTCSQSAHAARGQVTSASAPAPGAD